MSQGESIKITDLSQAFFQEYDQSESFTIKNLESYYDRFPNVFDNYFKTHCQRTPERLTAAIERYPEKYEAMKQTAKLLPGIIREVYEKLSKLMEFEMGIKTRILVGGFGSNAYVTHDGTLHFAIETVPDEPSGLKVLVAHEMAHAFHFEMLKRTGFDFSKLAWDGYTSLYLEGVAIIISEAIHPGLPDRVYFSFDDTSEDWIVFFRNNYLEILSAFKKDLQRWGMEEGKEWFRLRGGKRFGFNRLGYLIGREFIGHFVKEIGLKETMTFWAESEIKPVIEEWLNQVS